VTTIVAGIVLHLDSSIDCAVIFTLRLILFVCCVIVTYPFVCDCPTISPGIHSLDSTTQILKQLLAFSSTRLISRQSRNLSTSSGVIFCGQVMKICVIVSSIL